MAPPHEEEQESIDFGDNVDMGPFDQILEMDDDEDEREFSQSIVFGFLEQATETFLKMDEAFQKPPELSSLGHFLKGSSATLGFNKVRDECEKIQHWGHKKDETGTADEPDEAKCLRLIGSSIVEAKKAFAIVDNLMRRYYAMGDS